MAPSAEPVFIDITAAFTVFPCTSFFDGGAGVESSSILSAKAFLLCQIIISI